MNRHLIPVEISIVRGAGQRVEVNRITVHENRLEGLHREAMQGRRPIQQDRVILDQFLQDIPHLGHPTTQRLVLDLVKIGEGS